MADAAAVTTPAATTPAGTVAPAAPVTPPAQPPAVDPRFQALAKKEQQLVAEAQRVKGEREQHAKDLAELQEWKKLKADALRNPDAYMQPVYGKDWLPKINEYALNAKQVTPELIDAHVDRRLSGLEQRLADERKADAEKRDAEQKAQLASQVADWRSSVTEWVKTAPEYELINAYDAHEHVSRVIEKTFADTKKLLSPKEAADLVEKDLEERGRKTKKFTSAPAKPGAASASSSATITAGMTQVTPGAEAVGKTEAERIQRAIKAAEAVEARRSAARQ